MKSNSISITDRKFATSVVRKLCDKCCTFTVEANNSVCAIHPFMDYTTTAATKFKEFNYWLIKAKLPDRTCFKIQVHADMTGQALKIINMALETQRLIG